MYICSVADNPSNPGTKQLAILCHQRSRRHHGNPGCDRESAEPLYVRHLGNPLIQKEQVPNIFRYSGEYWDAATELQYLRARWYDPSIGRFLTEDTIKRIR
ncbi:RHS repeat-associated core domain-containing protein [Paenibacillus thiaminolyticus]